jgi:hypothetical protein
VAVHLLLAADTFKAPFGIAGAVLVAWAALVASFGLSRGGFPGGLRGQRAVIAVTVVIVAVVMGVAVQVG